MIDIKDINWNSLDIDGIDTADYPDFCDAFAISGYTKDGRELTDDELEYINDHYRDFIYERVIDIIF